MLLILHIAGGSLNLLLGVVIMILRKGGKRHSRLGDVFFYTMMLVAITAIGMIFIHVNLALASIALFSGYMAFSGKLVIRPDFNRRKHWLWPAMVVGIGTGIWMISSLNIILMVFGSILSALIVQDVVMVWRKDVPFAKRQASHIGKMTGAFTASTTAFLVNAVKLDIGWVLWMLPTIAITPFGIYWQIVHARRFRRMRTA